MRAAIVGFGLIGGSIALALASRGRGAWSVTAWSPRADDARGALARGLITAVAPDPETAVRSAELVVLAAPLLANLELVDRLGPLLAGGDATLTDVSSSQSAIAARATRFPDLHFVGGHPMSGREKRGFGAARADLFEGRPWAILPSPAARPADIERVRSLAEACGARPLEIDPETHDDAVAAVSHLPLLASVGLAETVGGSGDWPAVRQLSAQGWRDMTRLARGDPQLGAGIVLANGRALAKWLRRYREVLDDWQRVVDAAGHAAAGAGHTGETDAADGGLQGPDRELADRVTERFAQAAAYAADEP